METQSVFLALNSRVLKATEASEGVAEAVGRVTKDALARAFRKIKEEGPDWFVYENGSPKEDRLEDEGRTQIIHTQGLPEKIYAILEDYGDPAEWDQMYEPEVAADLREALGDKRHQLTILFASDY
jgi:hypothetical protein